MWWLCLFFIVLIAVIVLIMMKIKREKATRKTSSYLEEELRKSPVAVKAVSEVAMYVYEEPACEIHCPLCDGENPENLQYCEICGNKLN